MEQNFLKTAHTCDFWQKELKGGIFRGMKEVRKEGGFGLHIPATDNFVLIYKQNYEGWIKIRKMKS